MVPAAVADVVVVFLRLTFESEEPRGKESARGYGEERRGWFDLSAARRHHISNLGSTFYLEEKGCSFVRQDTMDDENETIFRWLHDVVRIARKDWGRG